MLASRSKKENLLTASKALDILKKIYKKYGTDTVTYKKIKPLLGNTNNSYLYYGIEAGILHRVKQGYYTLLMEPTDDMKLNIGVAITRYRQQKYAKRYASKYSGSEYDEQRAITLLKSLGYKILKPVTTHEEI